MKSKREFAAQLEHARVKCARDLAKSVAVIQYRAEGAVLGTIPGVETVGFGVVEGVETLEAQFETHAR